MFKYIVVISTLLACVTAKPGLIHGPLSAAPLVATVPIPAPVVTAASSQVVSRTFNGIAAAPIIRAPVAPLPAPIFRAVAPAAPVAPLPAPIFKAVAPVAPFATPLDAPLGAPSIKLVAPVPVPLAYAPGPLAPAPAPLHYAAPAPLGYSSAPVLLGYAAAPAPALW